MNITLNTLKSRSAPLKELVEKYGDLVIEAELQDMIYDDMENVAFLHAVSLHMNDTASMAAQAIVDSGAYSKETVETAKQFLLHFPYIKE
jgi:hypothetical protein